MRNKGRCSTAHQWDGGCLFGAACVVTQAPTVPSETNVHQYSGIYESRSGSITGCLYVDNTPILIGTYATAAEAAKARARFRCFPLQAVINLTHCNVVPPSSLYSAM